ncbi:LpxI family protein [Anatilimnocola floriformis]|uniref:LpxI family protein n=1 Tax=Anatilimnocola floriformis TaxID=2948575 RepID=UPI0020C46AA8|nr:UDP-2,3-diacylglucosamine diphosphatase LpxI [Anatilimnocola floriformis]
MNTSTPSAVGLIAGWGRYPFVIAQALKAQGTAVHCIAVAGHADPELAALCDTHTEMGVARIGCGIRHFKRLGVTRATMAGKIFKHKVLYSRFGWLSLVPDLRTVWAFIPMYLFRKRDRKDDTLLTVIVDEFAKDGIHMAPATDFAPELLVPAGILTRRQPTASELEDIAFGWQIAKDLGRHDVGQSVAVKGQAVIAIEAIEGTDECIRRAGTLCRQGGFALVKVAKPQQDMRFDVPTIGVGTIETLAAARAKLLAIEADKTIVLDRDEVVRLANKHGIALIATSDAQIAGGAWQRQRGHAA